MTQAKKFQLNGDEAKKLNNLLPKGYKLVTQQQFKKRAMLKPKKKTVMGLQLTPQIVNQSVNLSLNLSQSYNQKTPTSISAPNPIGGRSTKNTKFMGLQSYQSIPQNDYIVPVSNKSYDKIPISLDYYEPQRRTEVLSTPVVFSKLKTYPFTFELEKVQPEQYSLSFKDIERKVNSQRDNYKVHELVSDISKLCLKIYQTYSRDSNEYQNTVGIEKYLKSLTKVQKSQPVYAPSSNMGLTRQPSTISQVKKKPPVRLSDLNTAITIKQKRQLGQRIKKLPSQCLQQICYIIFENLENKDYSFDLDTLHVKKIRQLQDYVNSCLDYSQFGQNQDENRMGDDDEGEESSFIIEGDGEEDQTNAYEYQF